MNAVTIEYDRERDDLLLKIPYSMHPQAQRLVSAKWDKVAKAFRSKANLPNIEDAMTRFGKGARVTKDVTSLLDRLRAQNLIFQNLKDKQMPAEDAGYEWQTEPLPHQVTGTMAMLQRHRVLLGDEMGVGKTKQVIDVGCNRMLMGQIDRVFVICPASLKGNWLHELQDRGSCTIKDCDKGHHGLEGYNSTLVINGDANQRLEQFMTMFDYRWIILNYELARIHADDIKGEMKGQMLVLDEAHRLANEKAQTTEAVMEMARLAEYVYPITGTPLSNKPEDCWPIAQMVEEGLLGRDRWSFEDHFLVKQTSVLELFDRKSYKKIERKIKRKTGYKNLDEFARRMETIMIRRRRSQVFTLPPKQYQKRVMPMSTEQQKRYDTMKKELVTEYRHMPESQFKLRARNAASQLLRLQQIADGFISTGDKEAEWLKGNCKMAELDEVLAMALDNEEKVVVFSRFRAVTAEIERRYAAWGVVRFYGDVPQSERFALLERFQTDPECRIFAGQVHTAGLGVNLTASHIQVHYDRWWSISVNQQAEDRQHRYGMDMTHPLKIIDLLARGSIDHYLAKVLAEKREWADTVTGDKLFELTQANMMSILTTKEED